MTVTPRRSLIACRPRLDRHRPRRCPCRPRCCPRRPRLSPPSRSARRPSPSRRWPQPSAPPWGWHGGRAGPAGRSLPCGCRRPPSPLPSAAPGLARRRMRPRRRPARRAASVHLEGGGRRAEAGRGGGAGVLITDYPLGRVGVVEGMSGGLEEASLVWPAVLLLLEDGAGLAVPPVVHQKAPPQAGRRRCRGRSSTRLCPSFRSLTPLSVLLLAVPPPGVRIRRAADGRLPCCRSHLRAASVAGGPWVGRHRTTHYRSGHFCHFFAARPLCQPRAEALRPCGSLGMRLN